MRIGRYNPASTGVSFFTETNVEKKKDIEETIKGVHQYAVGSLENVDVYAIVLHYPDYNEKTVRELFSDTKHIRYRTKNGQNVCVFPLTQTLNKKEHDQLSDLLAHFCIKKGLVPNKNSFVPMYELNGAFNVEYNDSTNYIETLVSKIPDIKKVVRYSSVQRQLLSNTFVDPGEVALAVDYISKVAIKFFEWCNVIAVLNNLGKFDLFNGLLYSGSDSDKAFYKFDVNKKLKAGYILYIAGSYGYKLPDKIQDMIDEGVDSEMVQIIGEIENQLDSAGTADYRALIYHNGPKFLKISDNTLRELASVDLKPFVSKDKINQVLRYLMSKRLFLKSPISIRRWGFWDDDELVRDWSNTGEISVNRDSGIISISQKYPPLNESTKTMYIDFIDELLGYIFTTPFNISIIKKFMAQIICSYRTNARPALILTGLRGTGKSIFVDGILGSMVRVNGYENTIYNAVWKEDAAVIKVEESESVKYDLKKLYNDIKDYSGSATTISNTKHGAMYEIPATGTFIILSNESFPIMIKDDPRFGNQFFHITLTDVLERNPAYVNFSTQINLSKLKIAMYYYTRYVLIPLFSTMVGSTKSRYGFEIPVTKNLLALYEQSNLTRYGTDVLDFFNNVWLIYKNKFNQSSYPFNQLDFEDIKSIQEHLFITSTARKKIANNLSVKAIASIQTLVDFNINAIRIGGVSYTGVKITSEEALSDFLFPKGKEVLEIAGKTIDNTIPISTAKNRVEKLTVGATSKEQEILDSLGL